MGIGAKLKALRMRKGESLQQVADAVGASKPHIWELESEKSTNPSLDLLTSLAKHFGVPVSHILDEAPEIDAMVFGREFKRATEEEKKLFWQMAEKMLVKKPRG